MKWMDLLDLVGGEPVFESGMLLAGEDTPGEVRRQLTRWTASGQLIQLRRGFYAFSPRHAKVSPNPLAVAARLRRPSYLSLQSALAYHGLIPEAVPVVTSVTTSRPGKYDTDLGIFLYQHLQRPLFWGYQTVEVVPGQSAFVATPEKALLDLIYLTPHPVDELFLRELRLSPTAELDCDRLDAMARRTSKKKLIKAASLVAGILEEELHEEVSP